jgi:hypothetical protein
MTNVTASSRIALVGEEATYSEAYLGIAAGLLGLEYYGEAQWQGNGSLCLDLYFLGITANLCNGFFDPLDHLNTYGGYGLLDHIPATPPYFNPSSQLHGIIALGTGIVDTFLLMSPGTVVGGGDACVTIDIREDGAVVAQATVCDGRTGLRGFFPDVVISQPLLVKEGRVYTTGITMHSFPLIYAYSSGTGQGVRWSMKGNLAVGGAIMPMRGSMTVDKSL